MAPTWDDPVLLEISLSIHSWMQNPEVIMKSYCMHLILNNKHFSQQELPQHHPLVRTILSQASKRKRRQSALQLVIISVFFMSYLYQQIKQKKTIFFKTRHIRRIRGEMHWNALKNPTAPHRREDPKGENCWLNVLIASHQGNSLTHKTMELTWLQTKFIPPWQNAMTFLTNG